NPTTASGQTTSTVAGANLVNGLITATVVKADAHATRTNGVTSLTDEGTGFGSITVNGQVLLNVQPNTVRVIPGVGTLYLRREIRTANSIEIRMIELVVSPDNLFHLPAGVDLRVAVASVGAR
ncbi:MAG: hypothetical protein M3Z46_04740, partial [Actinomycetota bacterium]|nr:hypothetical protein [Actinomycetota bacterium]